MEDLEDSYPCGLDLGTTFSCIGIFKNGGVVIIPNKNGDKITPSIVTVLDENTILKGEETIDHLVKDYDSSIYAVKRFIGRDFKDPKVKNEIQFENLPFEITENAKTHHLVIDIKKNGKTMEFNLEEISSFIIRKMVDNAEDYLKRKINALVITVPANFKDAQRKATKQAAELAGLKVLRIINEPTAAALAYGLQEKNIKDNGNILVFDLGGGTFDVTILRIDKNKEDNEKIFEILSTCGDKFLGGEDFDNKLADYFLIDFCNKNKISKDIIKKDKQAFKRLKIACENIKKVLSNKEATELCISNFYDKKDINKKISRDIFENLCNDLFKKLIPPLKEALTLAKTTKDSIKEIVLVGGSTRIPKIKDIINEFFAPAEINDTIDADENKFPKINDTIDADETVAYGATLMATKILKKNSNFTSFDLRDITPFSLGTDIKNNSLDKEIQKEGNEMSVIIKRGSKIPIHNILKYSTTTDNQKEISLNVYEGEKKYVKYNHLLKEASLTGLTEKPAGKVTISVKFEIDENGILTVTGKEEDTNNKKENSIEIKIRNDGIVLNEDEMKKIKERNQKYMDKCKIKMKIDYKNLKETLKRYQDTLIKTEDEEDRFDIVMGCINFLEEFINKFDTNFDNETIIEKYYIYIKELFIYYIEAFKLKQYLDKSEKNRILEEIKKYLNIFIKLSTGYLDDLLEILKDLRKQQFYEIIVFVMEKFNECGINCLKEMEKFCRYNTLKYFERTKNIFNKYIGDFTIITSIPLQDKCKLQIATCTEYIEDINSYIILLCEDAIKFDKLISSGTGLTSKKKVLIDEEETYHIILETYEKMLPQYEGKADKKEALILVNIIKINYKLIGNINYNMYYKMAQRVEFILRGINPKPEWYKDFCEMYNDLKDYYTPEMEEEEMKDKIKKKYKTEFEEIDAIFNKKKSNLEFIEFILKKIPYIGYDKDKDIKKDFFKKESPELLCYLKNKYSPDKYTYKPEDEDSQLKFCLIGYIDGYFNRLYGQIN